MSNDILAIVSAKWDLRPATKILRVDGTVLATSFTDEVIVEVAVPQGINESILLLNVNVKPSGGPNKPQTVPFIFERATRGDEPWRQVTAVFQDTSLTVDIVKYEEIDVPTCLTGTITKLSPFSICMDDATHLIHSITEIPVRLMANNEEVLKALNDFTDAKAVVTVCGSYFWGPECSYLNVYYVGITEKLLGDDPPFPWLVKP
ncbi:MAG: hypothetical protein AB2809_22630 [Candidatus Thiodiazotropha sp.]